MISENIKEYKKELRKQIRLIKKDISADLRRKKSDAVLKKLEEHPDFIKAGTVFIFWSMDDEVDTRDFIIKWSDRKRFILPGINGDELHLKEFTGTHNLVSGDIYNIPEPDGTPFSDLEIIDIAVVPGIAFDSLNNRMGRGKAYYDRILHKIKGKAKLIGICYDFQYLEEVPVEPHDIKMDEVIYG